MGEGEWGTVLIVTVGSCDARELCSTYGGSIVRGAGKNVYMDGYCMKKLSLPSTLGLIGVNKSHVHFSTNA